MTSETEWMPALPRHWTLAPLGFRYEVQLGKMLNPEATGGEHLFPYLRNTDVQWGRINVIDLPVMSFDAREQTRFALRSGDLLVCEGGDIGRAAIWNGDLTNCFYQKALHRLRPWRSTDVSKYLYYVLSAASWRGAFHAEGNKSTIVHLTAEKLRAMRFPFPPAAEQVAIAAFLDRKTASIDSLVEKQELLLELLGRKRQALITARVAPGAAGWSKTRLAWVLREVQRPVDVVPELRYAEIGVRSHGRGTFHKDPVFGWELEEKRVYRVEPGDLVFNIVFAWERAVAIVQESDRGRIASHRFPTYRPVGESADMRFIRYLFLSDVGRFLLDQNSPGAAGRNRTLDRSALLKEDVWLPSVDLQLRIADELDATLSAIDRTCEALASQVEKTREYRQSVITAAVTGQIDVSREAA